MKENKLKMEKKGMEENNWARRRKGTKQKRYRNIEELPDKFVLVFNVVSNYIF